MKKVVFFLVILFFPVFVNANIICNDGTESPTCQDCHRGCCSWHGGCASTYSEPDYDYYSDDDYSDDIEDEEYDEDDEDSDSDDDIVATIGTIGLIGGAGYVGSKLGKKK